MTRITSTTFMPMTMAVMAMPMVGRVKSADSAGLGVVAAAAAAAVVAVAPGAAAAVECHQDETIAAAVPAT